MVRTIEKIDVNYPDAEELDKALSGEPPVIFSPGLEPIYKIQWTSFGAQVLKDPYDAPSTLVVLGGTLPDAGSAMTCIKISPLLLPSPSTPSRDAVHPEVRKSLSQALSSTKSYEYNLAGTAVDFQLVSKDSPHLCGGLNPYAVLVLTDSTSGLRTVEAREFPPLEFAIPSASAAPTPSETSGEEASNPLEKDLASTLESLRLSSEPADLGYALPTAVWSGINAICDGDIVRVEKEQYELLAQSKSTGIKSIESIGRGGIAWVDYGDDDQAGDLMFTKRQAHRFLVTHHKDLTIRFQDISPQLLIGSATSPLTTPFPAPFSQLTISLIEILSDPHVAVSTGLSPDQVGIQSVQLTSESTECLVTLQSGHVLVFAYALKERRLSEYIDHGGDFLTLNHIAARACSFHPVIMVKDTFGRVTSSGLSNIGTF